MPFTFTFTFTFTGIFIVTGDTKRRHAGQKGGPQRQSSGTPIGKYYKKNFTGKRLASERALPNP
jgi:hypothetical protein